MSRLVWADWKARINQIKLFITVVNRKASQNGQRLEKTRWSFSNLKLVSLCPWQPQTPVLGWREWNLIWPYAVVSHPPEGLTCCALRCNIISYIVPVMILFYRDKKLQWNETCLCNVCYLYSTQTNHSDSQVWNVVVLLAPILPPFSPTMVTVYRCPGARPTWV